MNFEPENCGHLSDALIVSKDGSAIECPYCGKVWVECVKETDAS